MSFMLDGFEEVRIAGTSTSQSTFLIYGKFDRDPDSGLENGGARPGGNMLRLYAGRRKIKQVQKKIIRPGDPLPRGELL